ncbi:MAG: CDP-diacylglycerol--glycerol-3-phosphate 3-phosphatidyltransferase [Bacteriovoracaceae bacterium]|nr:CDP-diacylglycerol--glycerol-3-phosphate 3-phosphatidyltransferase [Bacteriovoracaceae bacterium]
MSTHSNDLEIDNLPNRLTILRMLMIPFVVLSLYFVQHPQQGTGTIPVWLLSHLATWIFVAASITDFFDGWIARRRNIVTVFGSFLDPIADKFLVVSSLIMLAAMNRVHPVVVIILVVREMYMTSLRLLASHEGLSIPVSQGGKWKTGFQMVAIPMLMIGYDWLTIPWSQVGTICIWIAGILSLGSAFSYSLHMVQSLKHSREERKKRAKESV